MFNSMGCSEQSLKESIPQKVVFVAFDFALALLAAFLGALSLDFMISEPSIFWTNRLDSSGRGLSKSHSTAP